MMPKILNKYTVKKVTYKRIISGRGAVNVAISSELIWVHGCTPFPKIQSSTAVCSSHDGQMQKTSKRSLVKYNSTQFHNLHTDLMHPISKSIDTKYFSKMKNGMLTLYTNSC